MTLARTVAVLFALSCGCSKSGEGDKPAPQPSAPAASSAAPPAAPAKEPAGKTTTYAGTYSVAPAPYYISSAKDFSGVKQAKDDPSKHVGEGALSVTIDPDGKVAGTIDSGPASPAIIDGSVVKGEIRGTVRRKAPEDDGLTGTFAGAIAGDAVNGKLSLAESSAAIVREGKVTLSKK